MNKTVGVIYKLWNTIRSMGYVGQTLDFKRRMGDYKNSKGDRLIEKAIQEDGWENFIASELHTKIPLNKLNDLEEICIAEHNTLTPNGYNMVDIATGGIFYTDEELLSGPLLEVFLLEHDISVKMLQYICNVHAKTIDKWLRLEVNMSDLSRNRFKDFFGFDPISEFNRAKCEYYFDSGAYISEFKSKYPDPDVIRRLKKLPYDYLEQIKKNKFTKPHVKKSFISKNGHIYEDYDHKYDEELLEYQSGTNEDLMNDYWDQFN